MTAALLTSSQVAERLHETPETIVRRLRANKIRGHKVGRRWLVTEADLDAFLRATENVPPVDRRRRR